MYSNQESTLGEEGSMWREETVVSLIASPGSGENSHIKSPFLIIQAINGT